LPPPSDKRWMLGQLALSRPLNKTDSGFLAIEIDKVIGKTMTRSKIHAKDGLLGSMLFILS